MKDLTISNIERRNVLNNRYLQSNSDELNHNGYILCKCKQLKEFKLEFAHLINGRASHIQVFSDYGFYLQGCF